MSEAVYDAIVVGLGPGGSTTASCLARGGLRVLGIEKTAFPRYHIGESLTGSVGTYLRELGLEGTMKRHRFPVKHGVTVIGPAARSEFFVPVAPQPTWQVRRDLFDQMLLDDAVDQGVETLTGVVSEVLFEEERVTGVRVALEDREPRDIRARYLIDASGTSTLLARSGIAGERRHEDYAAQIAVFSQLRGCATDPGLMAGNTVIFYDEPYHWAWLIPLDDDVCSLGIVVTTETYRRLGQEHRWSGAEAPRRVFEWGLQHLNPELSQRVRDAQRVDEVHALSDYCYRVEPFAGDGWLCVGDAHCFLDPIFSFGVSLAMTEGRLAADAIMEALSSGESRTSFENYQRRCTIGQDAIADVIRYFWRFPAFFGVQAQGSHRSDIMQLFAGAAHDDQPLAALQMMRESLARANNGSPRTGGAPVIPALP